METTPGLILQIMCILWFQGLLLLLDCQKYLCGRECEDVQYI